MTSGALHRLPHLTFPTSLGFAHLTGDPSRVGNRFLALDPGESLEVDPSDLGGINVWLMEAAAELGGFTVTYELWKPHDTTAHDRALLTIQALEMGYDCVLTSAIHSYERCAASPPIRIFLPGR